MEEQNTLDSKALELFAEGKSTNYVAMHLLNKNWARAKKLKGLFDEQNPHPMASNKGSCNTALPGSDKTETGSDESEPLWDLTLQVPASRATDMFATFTVAEQMEAIAHVLQRRMDEALAQDEDEV